MVEGVSMRKAHHSGLVLACNLRLVELLIHGDVPRRRVDF